MADENENTPGEGEGTAAPEGEEQKGTGAEEENKIPADEEKKEGAGGEEEGGEEKAGGEAEPKEPTIQELIDSQKELTNRLDKSEKRVGYLTRKQGSSAQPALKPLGDKPKQDDFETAEAFTDALTDYKVDKREHERADARGKEDTVAAQQEFFQEIATGPTKYKDFNDVARKRPEEGGPTVNETMLRGMAEYCNNTVDVAYWLGENVQESQRIARLRPLDAVAELVRIDAKFGGGEGAPEKKNPGLPRKEASKITSTKTVAGKSKNETSLENMGMDDFMNSRNKRDGVE